MRKLKKNTKYQLIQLIQLKIFSHPVVEKNASKNRIKGIFNLSIKLKDFIHKNNRKLVKKLRNNFS